MSLSGGRATTQFRSCLWVGQRSSRLGCCMGILFDRHRPAKLTLPRRFQSSGYSNMSAGVPRMHAPICVTSLNIKAFFYLLNDCNHLLITCHLHQSAWINKRVSYNFKALFYPSTVFRQPRLTSRGCTQLLLAR